jgi:hypothetical protein
MVVRAFLPERITTTPPVTSPSPSSSAMPRRISGPICSVATSRNSTGVAPDTANGIVRKSSSDFRKPRERTMYSASASSITDPPEAWLAFCKACTTMAWVTASARMRSGSSTTWNCLTMPPMLATSATSGTVFSSNFRNQSLSARSWPRSLWPLRSTSAYS